MKKFLPLLLPALCALWVVSAWHSPSDKPGTIPANAFGRLPNISIAGSDPTTLKHQYNGTSTHSLASMLLLGRAVREQAAATAPAVKTIAVDTNDNDDVIVNSAVDQLAADWTAHGATVTTFVFPKSDGLAHDVFQPFRVLHLHLELRPRARIPLNLPRHPLWLWPLLASLLKLLPDFQAALPTG